jgi:hypothetical protein
MELISFQSLQNKQNRNSKQQTNKKFRASQKRKRKGLKGIFCDGSQMHTQTQGIWVSFSATLRIYLRTRGGNSHLEVLSIATEWYGKSQSTTVSSQSSPSSGFCTGVCAMHLCVCDFQCVGMCTRSPCRRKGM